MNRILHTLLLCSVVAIATLPASAAELATQKSSSRGVTVDVTPRNINESTKTWDFKIVLDTHSEALNDDLVKSTVLVTGGIRHTPLAWEGDPPGSHHREGTLKFTPVKPLPEIIELQIRRPGETSPRSFQWKLR